MKRLKLILVLTTVLVALAACSSDDDGGGGEVDTADAGQSATDGYGSGGSDTGDDAAAADGGATSLTASGNAWSPAVVSLTSGAAASITVENADSVKHSFTFEDAQVDQDIEGGQTADISFTAPAAGEYGFFCKYHSSMTGTVTVA